MKVPTHEWKRELRRTWADMQGPANQTFFSNSQEMDGQDLSILKWTVLVGLEFILLKKNLMDLLEI